jgi:hypothetical protein
MNPNEFEMRGLAEPERWKPKEGDLYWWLAVEKVVQVWTGNWTNHRDDQLRWELCNCFKSTAKAEQARDKVKDLLVSLHNE